ncbi:hypothetical protein EBS02_08145 [bacterium]|nr:hypothetical protein [bacterium]
MQDNEDLLPEIIKISSLRELDNFQKIGSSNFLIHKSTLDFWQMSDDGSHIVKLVSDDQGPVQG